MPYEGWWDHCVAGRAQIAPHKRRDKTQDEIPVIQMDYLEWTRKLLEADPNSGTMSLTLVDKVGHDVGEHGVAQGCLALR